MSRTSLLLLLGLIPLLGLSCADPFVHEGNREDQDDDGYTAEVDCDDKDKDIYPGAPERENCLDDNCDGRIDEGTSNEDLDNDGFCPTTGDIPGCEGNAKRHPGMAEDGGLGDNQPNGIDDDCDGEVDEGLPTSDMDGDGFTVQDDCNDRDPNINPGAIEVEGQRCRLPEDCPTGRCYDGYCRCVEDADCSSNNLCSGDEECTFPGETCQVGKCVSNWSCEKAQTGIPNPTLRVCRDLADNDCDGQKDEVPAACDTFADLDQADPYDFARAMELCDTDKTCGIDTRCPGQLKCVKGKCSRLLNATFNSDADSRARAIAVDFAKGGPFKPKMGDSFVILSTGIASYVPKDACPEPGMEFSNTHLDPDPTVDDKEANDYVELALEILVPTNAQSFEFDFQFFSTEFPEYVGSQYNDTFWVELDSKSFRGNISFDSQDTPIRINNAFFEICDAWLGKPQTAQMCKQPNALLDGTGYAKDCFSPESALLGIPIGGSTGWLHTTAPVTPGEIIKLTFSIFDKGDHSLDSAVLIDNFRWKLSPALHPSTGPD